MRLHFTGQWVFSLKGVVGNVRRKAIESRLMGVLHRSFCPPMEKNNTLVSILLGLSRIALRSVVYMSHDLESKNLNVLTNLFLDLDFWRHKYTQKWNIP